MSNCQEWKIKTDMQFEKLANSTKRCLMFRKMKNNIVAQLKSEVAKKNSVTYTRLICSIQKKKLKSIDFVAIFRNNPYLVTQPLFDKSAKQLEIFFKCQFWFLPIFLRF